MRIDLYTKTILKAMGRDAALQTPKRMKRHDLYPAGEVRPSSIMTPMAKAEQATPQFHFQKSHTSSRVTVLNNLNYIMAEYDETTGVTRWTRVVPAAQREHVQQWLLKNYPVLIESPAPARRKKAA